MMHFLLYNSFQTLQVAIGNRCKRNTQILLCRNRKFPLHEIFRIYECICPIAHYNFFKIPFPYNIYKHCVQSLDFGRQYTLQIQRMHFLLSFKNLRRECRSCGDSTYGKYDLKPSCGIVYSYIYTEGDQGFQNAKQILQYEYILYHLAAAQCKVEKDRTAYQQGDTVFSHNYKI